MSTTRLGALLILVGLFSPSLNAQSSAPPPVSIVFAVLAKSLDSRNAVIGDELTLRTISDVVVDSRVVIPKGSKLLGRVGGAVTKGKDEPKTALALIIDKSILTNEIELPLQAIIVAIAAPQKSLSSDPTYAMMHSNEPKMVGSGPRGATSSGSLPASSKANSTAAVATAQIKGIPDEPLALTPDSQGAFGYEGLSISWHLAMPPPLTVLSTKARNLRLEAGTQVVIRMAQPRLPQ